MKHLMIALFFLSSLTGFSQREKSSVLVGQKAPEFSAIDQNGNMVNSQDILNNEELIVVFYRGEWCPYCNKHLKLLEEHVSDFKKAGARLVAITPEIPVSISKTIEKTKAEYSILYDKDARIMKAYGVDFVLPEKLREKYKEYGIDLTKSNGNTDQMLPVPATYVIGKDGMVKYFQYDPDYKNRSTPKEILMHL